VSQQPVHLPGAPLAGKNTSRCWVLASSNRGKCREFEEALAPFLAPRGIVLRPQSDFGVTPSDEPHDTFAANALEKARHASRLTGLPALADDSGLCVDLLGGAPGVRSARYWQDARARAPAAVRERLDQRDTDEANLLWLLHEMARVTGEADHASGLQGARHAGSTVGRAEYSRTARFEVALALVRDGNDPNPVVVRGQWSGVILDAPRGSAGFGYDPIFLDPSLQLSAAEMPLSVKQAAGHRGMAVRALLRVLTDAGWS
jgi:XTP/dITP diphosphohydrolase